MARKAVFDSDVKGNALPGLPLTASILLQFQNNLQGSIPQQISLPSLVVLDLSRNQLEGSLPLLPQNEKLQMALFSHNQFSGSIPAPPPANQLGTKCELHKSCILL